MPDSIRVQFEGKTIDLPVIVGTENEHAVDISKLRAETGYITLDEGYGNTGACQSAITFIDGDKGILKYRGIPIEVLAEKSSFIETAYLLIWGHLPTRIELTRFRALMTKHQMLREQLRNYFGLYPPGSPPMAVLSAVLNSMTCFYPELLEFEDVDVFEETAARIMSKTRTIAAHSYKHERGHYLTYPHPDKSFSDNFLHMMFSEPYNDFTSDPELVRALDVVLLLHADHEQNCSTSTVRMVGSSGANLFASLAAGVSALWGPLHGGANVAVVEMLEKIVAGNLSVKDFVKDVKDKKNGIKLMGFGHRVYKNFDPRATIIRNECEKVLAKLHQKDDLLSVAQELAQAALEDDYFIERKLYPNVDFYSGVILRALGIPTSMFTVIFAIGRMPGWIAQWYEDRFISHGRIQRPRQLYTGPTDQEYVSIDDRG
jgi:citrate synthase